MTISLSLEYILIKNKLWVIDFNKDYVKEAGTEKLLVGFLALSYKLLNNLICY